MGISARDNNRSNIQIIKCPTKLNVAVPHKLDDITLNGLQDVVNYQRVNVMIKVLAQKEILKINGLLKQDYTVGDVTGTATLITWEN